MKKLKRAKLSIALVAILTITVSFKSDFFEVAKQIELYTSIFKELNMHYIDEVNPTQMTSEAVNKMLTNLDPYTRYYDEQRVEDFKIKSRGEYGGIGAKSTHKDKKLFIREVYEGLPADKAGIKAGDEIIKINELSVKDYEGETINNLLKGLPDTKVNVEVNRNGKTIKTEITREKIEIDPVPFYQMIDEEIGYISFVTFNKQASKRVKEAYDDLKDDGMKKLIIDVRSNPGGLLNEAVKIVNYFVPKDQIVVTTRSKVKKWSNTYKTKNEPIDTEIPIVILVNRRSASASEILAGSIQDLDRGVVVGERSFGKGLVQRTRKLPYGTQMKLTISKYYTPSGRCIQELDYTNKDPETGVVPKFDPKNRNVFKTLNGRKVYDGGGIEPDVKIEKPAQTISTKALLRSDAIFKYASQYQYDHPSIATAEDFKLSDSDFNAFLNFIKTEKTSFKTKAELAFEEAHKKADEEKFDSAISTGYNQLLSQIKTKRISDLSQNKDEILGHITDEILKQFYYKKGIYLNKFAHDKTIVDAASLLRDMKKYEKILK